MMHFIFTPSEIAGAKKLICSCNTAKRNLHDGA